MIEQGFLLGKGLNLKNRLVVAPMTTYSSHDDGTINPEEIEYLKRRAEGGFGLIITAACYVHPHGQAFSGQWGCSDDKFLPSLQSVADAIHEGGSKAILQIHHGGRQCPAALCGGRPLSASAIPTKEDAPVPYEMTEDEILETIDAFAKAAARAKQAGYDGVEIHGANTYLLQQFVSPHSNRRSDSWGQNRLKFPLAVTDAVLEAVGPDFPVGYRFSPEEADTPGIRIGKTYELIDELCKRKLSYLHISLRDYQQGSLQASFEGPTLDNVAKYIGDRLPLIGVGSVKTVADAEAILAAGSDLVAIGRTAITDPDWPLYTEQHREPQLKVPATHAKEKLVLPTILTEKIYAVTGWFDIESA